MRAPSFRGISFATGLRTRASGVRVMSMLLILPHCVRLRAHASDSDPGQAKTGRMNTPHCIAVILTARDAGRSKTAVTTPRAECLDVHFHPLDVTSEQGVETQVRHIKRERGRLDILVNNASVVLDRFDRVAWVSPPARCARTAGRPTRTRPASPSANTRSCGSSPRA
ncbi:MAG: SDR family NAD(P)-dependent oxidoreductase [Gammaproteobacteria bacterium]|nr:MAG: SDR family NAD(P)-dependent oxidoreductase [Gammaproteobacteria bacterium]